MDSCVFGDYFNTDFSTLIPIKPFIQQSIKFVYAHQTQYL